MGLPAHEPRAEDDVGAVLQDRLDDPTVFHRVVFEVGVLDDHDVARRLPEAGPQGGSLAHVPRLQDQAGSEFRADVGQQVAGAVL
jgi:hypothetical protein